MLLHKEDRRILAEHASIASSPWEQLRGLIGRDLAEDTALVITPGCRQVHTAFLRYPIDVAFCRSPHDSDWEVVHVMTLPPWRISPYIPEASFVIEMHAGKLTPYLKAGSCIQPMRKTT